MSEYENVDVEVSEGVGYLTIEGSNQLNALDVPTADGLLEAAIDLSEDAAVRCIVVTGEGGAFGAGADLSTLEGDESDGARLRRVASTLHDAILQLHQAEKPVVTAVEGIAAGAGFSLALVGDLVFVSEDARLEFAYQRVGLTGDGGSTFFLPRLLGLRRAKELVLLDEPLDAERAVEMGIATEAVADGAFDDRVSEVAERLAQGPTKAYGATKQLLTESFERDLAGQLAAELDTIANATETEDYSRGHAAFFEKGDPEFTGE